MEIHRLATYPNWGADIETNLYFLTALRSAIMF